MNAVARKQPVRRDGDWAQTIVATEQTNEALFDELDPLGKARNVGKLLFEPRNLRSDDGVRACTQHLSVWSWGFRSVEGHRNVVTRVGLDGQKRVPFLDTSATEILGTSPTAGGSPSVENSGANNSASGRCRFTVVNRKFFAAAAAGHNGRQTARRCIYGRVSSRGLRRSSYRWNQDVRFPSFPQGLRTP